MSDLVKKSLFGLSPSIYGIASLIAASISLASVWLVFNMGPDGILNNWWFGAFAIGLLPLFGITSGLLGVGGGFHRRNWFGMITGAVGLAMSSCEAWFAWFGLVAGR